MDGAVIDLGLATSGEPDPPPPPSRGRRRPRVPGRLLPIALLVGTLGTVTAAAPPRHGDPVLSHRDANTVLSFGPDDTAYVTTQGLRSSRLQAYRPDRTAPLWTVNFPGGYALPILAGDPGLLTLTVYDIDPGGRGGDNAVQGRDARTGRLLWTRAGTGLLGIGPEVAVTTDRREAGGSNASFDAGSATSPVGGSASGPGAGSGSGFDPGADPGTGPGSGSGSGTIETVDRRTGVTRWSRPVPPDVLVGWEVAPDHREPTIVELARDGRLRLSDPSTGALRREVRLALLGVPRYVYVLGGLAVVHQEHVERGDVGGLTIAYDLASGAERSRQALSPVTSLCGERYLCVGEPDELTVTDLASGAVRFQGRSDEHQIQGDRLIVSWRRSWQRSAGVRVYDLRSGDRLHDYPGWSFAGADTGATFLTQEVSGQRLLVAMLDATGRLSVVGRGAGWTGTASCTRGVRHLGCTGLSGVRIWRLPRGTP